MSSQGASFEAWRRVKPEGWKLRIVGPDEAGYRSRLEAVVRDLGLEGEIRFDGPYSKAQTQQALMEAKLVILPSHSENFGLIVGEALAAGVPVLTTTGTPWKCLADNGCGWWVPATTDAIAAALLNATSTSLSDLKRMGAVGREIVKHEYSWDRLAKIFVELYLSIIH